MRRSRVTTSRCLILPLEAKHSVRAGQHHSSRLAGHPTFPKEHSQHPETAQASQTEFFSTYFASGSYSDQIRLNSSKW